MDGCAFREEGTCREGRGEGRGGRAGDIIWHVAIIYFPICYLGIYVFRFRLFRFSFLFFFLLSAFPHF